MSFDWDGFASALVDEISAAARSCSAGHDEPPYGVAVFGFYADGETISWPMIGVAYDDDVEPEDRWHPYDWADMVDGSATGDDWSVRLSAYASADRGKRWNSVEKRFYRTVIAACKTARKAMLADGTIGKKTLVVAIDEGEDLVPKCLTRAQVRREFPHLDAEQAEIDRIAGLPVDEQITELLDSIQHEDRPLDWESAPPLLYAVAVDHREEVIDALLHRLTADPSPEYQWRHRWISALSDLGADRDDVVDILLGLTFGQHTTESVRGWSTSTLCRFGRLPLLASRYDNLRPELHRCFAAAYTSPLPGPVDFAPLEALLDDHPELDDVMLDELRLNHDVTTDRVDAYFDALSSPWASIRRHAAWSLVFTRLSDADLARYRAALDVLDHDPSPAVAGRVDDLRTILTRGD